MLTAAPTILAPVTEWSTYLERHPEGTLSCGPAWLDLLKEVYGITSHPLTAMNTAGGITGVLVLCEIASPLLGKRLVSLPFADHAPLLADDEESAQSLVDQAISFARERSVRYLELRTGANSILPERLDVTESNLYVRWLVPLTADAAQVWSGVRKPVQRQVNKARHLGVTIRVASRREDMERYYRLHLRTRCRKHGMPAQPRRFFQALWETFAAEGALQLLLAEHAGEVIAAMIFLGTGRTLRYAYGASDERYLQLGPNNLLLWTAIERACEQGYRALDLGRTALDNEGLMQFKRGWGAEQVPLPYYYFPRAQGLAVTSEQSRKYQLATGFWKRLPLWVAGPLGGALYKHLG
jgi:FemAB-related protein (PEP-CTERM system-associated)